MAAKVVLYIEDNPADVELLTELLREAEMDAHVVAFERPTDALQFLEVRGTGEGVPPPHVILIDLHLPIESGVEVMKKIEASPFTAKVPMFAFTSRDCGTVRDLPKERCLTKPVHWQGWKALGERLRPLLAN